MIFDRAVKYAAKLAARYTNGWMWKEVIRDAWLSGYRAGVRSKKSYKARCFRAESKLDALTKENEQVYKDRNEAFKLWDEHKADVAALQSKLDSAEKELSFARQVAVLRGETIDRMERELIEAKAESRRLEGTLTQHCENPDTCRNVPDTSVPACPRCGDPSDNPRVCERCLRDPLEQIRSDAQYLWGGFKRHGEWPPCLAEYIERILNTAVSNTPPSAQQSGTVSACHPQPGKGDTYGTVDGKRWCSSCHAEQSGEEREP